MFLEDLVIVYVNILIFKSKQRNLILNERRKIINIAIYIFKKS